MTNKLRLAENICRYGSLSNYDVQTAGSGACISGCRRLRDLAKEYMIRRHAKKAYDYAENYYYFTNGFRKFLRVWVNRERERINKANGRVAA